MLFKIKALAIFKFNINGHKKGFQDYENIDLYEKKVLQSQSQI